MSLAALSICALVLASGVRSQELDGRAALARDPRTLPRATPERWSGWRPADPVPDPLAPALAAGIRAYRDGDYGLALAAFFALLEREPDFPPALHQAGTTCFRLRRYGDSAVLFERFVQAAPREIGATQALGHCYYTLGEYERARAHYERVLAAAPESAEAWRGLGLAHLRLGAPERALECLDRTLASRPDHAEAHAWRAQALLDLGRAEDALAAATRARDLAPHESRPWFLLARLFTELGREAEAASARARFEELDRIEQHIRAQEGLLLHDPHAVAPLARLVALHAASGDAEATRATWARLERAAPEDLDLHLIGLGALAGVGAREDARRLAATIESRFGRRADAWRSLARFYAEAGDQAAAARAEERLLELGRGE